MMKGKKFSEKAFKKGKGPNANSPEKTVMRIRPLFLLPITHALPTKWKRG